MLIVIIQVTNVTFCRKIENNMVIAFRRDEAYVYVNNVKKVGAGE